MSRRTLFDALHENGAADVELLRQKDGEGDTFSIARDVDFAFRTEDRARAEDLANFVHESNYGVAELRDGAGGLIWVIVVIHTPVTQHVICCLSAFMVCLSRLYGVEFDGWGSVVQTGADTSATPA